MSFWSAIGGGLKKIVHVADKVTDALEPFQAFISAIPGPFGAIFNLILTVEHASEPQAVGADRKAAVLAFMRLKYPKLDPEKIGPLVDQQISILNALAAAVEEAEKK